MRVIPKKKSIQPVKLYLEDIEYLSGLLGEDVIIEIKTDGYTLEFDSFNDLAENIEIGSSDNIKISVKKGLLDYILVSPYLIFTDYLSSPPKQNEIENYLRQREDKSLKTSIIHFKYQVPRKVLKKEHGIVNNINTVNSNQFSIGNNNEINSVNEGHKNKWLWWVLGIIGTVLAGIILNFLWEFILQRQ